ncbi:DUF1501 domain-containing protein [Marinicellulosiphila megalodicopiae]|uniref:DUF1501 domain-containing protein n=1 Tax=Marinicellulosiphila megalodicopiae TaxID=2724896 RepID=UPI003BB0E4C8
MNTNRRNFIKNMTLSSGMMTMPLVAQNAVAAGSKPDQFFVYYHCSGGWDPTSFIDPKGDADRGDNRGDDSRVNKFTADQILQRGNLRYAPLWINNAYVDDANIGVTDPDEILSDDEFALNTLNDALNADATIRTAAQEGLYNAFVYRYQNKLRFINGVNHQTNSHQTGARNATSGTNGDGYPNFSALYAAMFDGELPMAFITDGQGYNFTADLVPESRLDDVNNISYITDTNKIDANYNYYDADIYDLIENSREQRNQHLLSKTELPSKLRRVQLTQAAKAGGELQQLIDALSVDGSLTVTGLNNQQRQMSIAAASFANGLAASCHIASNGGFDTHSNSDNGQSANMREVCADLHHLWQQLESKGIADQTTVIVGSDFGRTPWYNTNNGKDHWNVSSMIAMGNGVTGNKVINGTDALVNAVPVNSNTLEPDANGVILTPAHVHQALRQLFNVTGSGVDAAFALDAQVIPILNG